MSSNTHDANCNREGGQLQPRETLVLTKYPEDMLAKFVLIDRVGENKDVTLFLSVEPPKFIDGRQDLPVPLSRNCFPSHGRGTKYSSKPAKFNERDGRKNSRSLPTE